MIFNRGVYKVSILSIILISILFMVGCTIQSDSPEDNTSPPQQDNTTDENNVDNENESDNSNDNSESNNSADNEESTQGKKDEGTNSNQNESSNENENSDSQSQDLAGDDLKKHILDKGDQIVQALHNQDFKSLATYAHQQKGLTFSPYVYIHEEDVTISKDELPDFFTKDTTLQWGTYDGSGKPIELTPQKYFEEFIYDKNYLENSEVIYNEDISRGNMKSNLREVYPEGIMVEYHVPGTTDNHNMDWSSLRLVFIKEDNDWYLVHIIHDQWTI